MWYWLSNVKMTVAVKTDENDNIVESAPIVRRFTGQNLENLAMWMNRQKGFEIEEMKCGDMA